MPTKANGPLMEDYNRAMKAARKHGWKIVRVKIGDCEITIAPEDTLAERLAPASAKVVKLSW